LDEENDMRRRQWHRLLQQSELRIVKEAAAQAAIAVVSDIPVPTAPVRDPDALRRHMTFLKLAIAERLPGQLQQRARRHTQLS
jgi:hypothetical protein